MQNPTTALALSLTLLTGSAQTPSTPSPQTPPAAAQTQSPKPALAFGLEDGTPVRLTLTRTVSSADARVDERIDFEVVEDVKVKDVIVIPRGGIAWGTVTEAQPKRRMGRGGKLNVNIDSVKLTSGEKVGLRAVKDMQGGGHVGKMTGAIVATSIVFFPAAPLFLFMKGKDITIPKGTEITAYVSADIPLDPAKFGAAPAATAASPAPPASAEQAMITIKSEPEGADITVDGKFVGSTPSSLKLAEGEHKITVQKSGFTLWERTVNVGAGGNVTLNATLEKSQP